MTGHMAHSSIGHVAHMASMGLLVSVLAPVLMLALVRAFPRCDRAALPAAVALPGFVVLHAAVTVATGGTVATPVTVPEPAGQLILLAGALVFWAPVLGVRRRLPEVGRTLYLYLAMPLLDLAGVWLVATGDTAGGIAMIVGMLPMGLTAVALTWRWVTAEERRACTAEQRRPGTGEDQPAVPRRWAGTATREARS